MPTKPQSAYDAFTASPGTAHPLTVRAATGSVLVGGAMARELGLASEPGSTFPGRVRRVTGAAGDIGAQPARRPAAAWLPAELAMPRDQLVVSPLLGGASDAGVPGPSPETEYQSRADRYDWLLLPLVPLSVWLLLMRSRRSELALYALSGARPAHVALMLWLEALPVAVAASPVPPA